MRLSQISIKNYKGIDSLEFELLKPIFEDEPDIFLICGENGTGKSSVLECSALVLMAAKLEKLNSAVFWDQLPERKDSMVTRLPDLLVASDSSSAEIVGYLEDGNKINKVRLIIDDEGIFLNEKKVRKNFELCPINSNNYYIFCLEICDILGLRKEPVINDKFLYFSSFRNHRYSSPELSETWNRKQSDREWTRKPQNLFKKALLDIIMAGANVLEFDLGNGNKKNSNGDKNSLDSHELALDSLNEIILKYAGGKVGKIWALPDSSYDFRIQIKDQSFSLDSLGSGHKEIISTLFFIRYFSKDVSKVVFLDEPELHLNAQWHREFMDDATKKSNSNESRNQFIVATNSEDIFASVDKRNRSMLVK